MGKTKDRIAKGSSHDAQARPVRIKDYVGFRRSLRNKLRTVISYNRTDAFKKMKNPEDFLRALRSLETEKDKGDSAVERAALLWSLERLIREARRIDNGAFLLQESCIEKFLPILHVGWGMDSCIESGFDYDRLAGTVEADSHPKYRLLALEPVGIAYLACQQPLKSRLIGLRIQSLPDCGVDPFFSRFSEQELDIISHGFGRGAYFQAYSLRSALKKALRCQHYFNPFVAVRGVAFAYAMVNTPHLDAVYTTAETWADEEKNREEIPFFLEGIASALSFLEWNFPGLLKTLDDRPITRNAIKMLESYRSFGGVCSL